MLRIRLFGAVCACTLPLGPGAAAEPTSLASLGYAIDNGDVNGDQDRDLNDAIALLGFLYTGGAEPAPLAMCAGGPTTARNGEVMHLFHFTADPSLVAIDPCVTGTSQPAVVDGYFLMFAPFPAGEHILRISLDFAGSPITPTTNFITVAPPGKS